MDADIKKRLELEREIDPVTNCWLWCGGEGGGGYGTIQICGKQRYVHRVAFEIYVAKPKNLVLHKCGRKLCYNPHHLYDGNDRDNLRDSYLNGERGEKKMRFDYGSDDRIPGRRG